METILSAEQDVLLRAAKRNAEQYTDSELAVKDKLLNSWYGFVGEIAMDKVNKENNTSGHMQLDLTYDEVNLLRECMKRTEDYYRGLILLKSEWHPEQNKDVLSYMKAKVRLIDNLQEKTLYDGQPEYYRQMQWVNSG